MELPAEITVVIDLNTKIQGYKQSILIIFFYIYVVSVNNSDQYPYMEAVNTFNDHYSVWLDSSIYMYMTICIVTGSKMQSAIIVQENQNTKCDIHTTV